MSVIVGEGDYRFEFSNDWAKVPSELAWVEVARIRSTSSIVEDVSRSWFLTVTAIICGHGEKG